jgi:hypothetical protein
MPDVDPALEQAIGRAYRRLADPDPARLAAILTRVEREAAPRALRKHRWRWVVLPLVLGAAAAVAGYAWLAQEKKTVHPVAVESPVEAAQANGDQPAAEPGRHSVVGAAGSESPGSGKPARGVVIFRNE